MMTSVQTMMMMMSVQMMMMDDDNSANDDYDYEITNNNKSTYIAPDQSRLLSGALHT